MNIKLNKRELEFITDGLKSSRNILRRKSNYDGVGAITKARMRVRANEMDNLLVKLGES